MTGMKLLLAGIVVCVAAAGAYADDNVARKSQEAIKRHDTVVSRADAHWKQQVLAAKRTLLRELSNADDPAVEQRIREEAKAIEALERTDAISSTLTKPVGSAPSSQVEMYDAIKEPNRLNAGLPLYDSSKSPVDPLKAYDALEKGMEFDAVLAVLGGWQKENVRDETREVLWIYRMGNGGELEVRATFVKGKLVSFSRSR